MLHKNVNFWIRLFYRLLDLITFFSLITLLSYLCVIKATNNKHIPPLNYYYFWFSTIIVSLALFLIIPFTFEGRTVWMIAFRVQILCASNTENKSTKKLLTKSYLLRSLFSFWIWLFLVLLVLTFIMPWQVDDFYKFLISPKTDNAPINFIFLERFLQTIVGLYFLFLFIDTLVIIVNKKNLGIIDSLSSSRIVWIKHYSNDENIMPKLLPFKADNKPFNIIS
ncbi:hypothetical protein MBOVJF4428_00332 [Mycoplasmopsis agalactiae]|uniref:RDD domain-containing protein n=3 Tax=Mycoplasmopsis agalactiae TaxID=2110 RepID=A5IY89_MYCAP|nr:hypothetical protein [Mycoplasmopsis agalactiae]CAL58998.1 Conserved hypothetical protein [Mycoplasmopsis agalactiae PG2]MCE6078856.1 hypothetical protein [Mycoplasmopsis agalactiae]MCE6095241.1 hypothetical protein [Mycoplasmopsis agalactiae]MCE6114497.1 hypothetical protein [Mycoplasmopsis agalactiae]